MLSSPTATSATSRRLVVVEINSVVSRGTHGHDQHHVLTSLERSDLIADASGVAVAGEIDSQTIGDGANPAEDFLVDLSPTGAETALGSLAENPILKFGRIYKRIA